ncbi:MAG: M14 family zinc carboxypeptidase [Clostridia bacterium]|nr:M14 family zinc carboxypeptidase [Clostridia bacterium]
MEEKNFLKNYIMSYDKIMNTLYVLFCNNRKRLEKRKIGVTTFNYPIDCYKIGNGKKHVLLYGTTHGSELVTTYFVLEVLISLLQLSSEDRILQEYTFHIIPILNPEGYIISSSNVLANVSSVSLEKIAAEYLRVYNQDDEVAMTGKKCPKAFYNVLKSNIYNIPNHKMARSVGNILKNCRLNASVLPVWTANGVGVDPNSNSIHCFKEIVELRRKQKCAYLRYNDIPVTIPSPMSYPGVGTFCNCPENHSLYQYVTGLYTMNTNSLNENKLIAIFSYHSTGGEIYSFPNKNGMDEKKEKLYKMGMEKYKENVGYTIIDPETRYGVMDYYRDKLTDVLCLTIELSKANANPIGPFANIEGLNREILNNKKAIIDTIDFISGN